MKLTSILKEVLNMLFSKPTLLCFKCLFFYQSGVISNLKCHVFITCCEQKIIVIKTDKGFKTSRL